MWALPFSLCLSQKMSEKVWRMDLLSLSKANEKTNINHSSAHGPSAQSLGEWHKNSKNVVFKSGLNGNDTELHKHIIMWWEALCMCVCGYITDSSSNLIVSYEVCTDKHKPWIVIPPLILSSSLFALTHTALVSLWCCAFVVGVNGHNAENKHGNLR